MDLAATTTGGLDGAVQIGKVSGTKLNMKPGDSMAVKVPVTLPAVVGDYQVLAVVDSADAIAEADETNNTALTSAVAVRQPFVDLAVSIDRIKLPETLTAGSRGTISVIVRNEGNVTAKGVTDLRLHASADAILDPADVLLEAVDAKKVSLKPGKQKKFTLKFEVPEGLAAGDYRFLAEILPDLRLSFLETPDSDATNNVAATALTYQIV